MRQHSISLLALLTFAACGGDDPPSPTAVRAAIHDDLHYVLTEGKTAADSSTTDLPTSSLLSFASISFDSSSTGRALGPIATRLQEQFSSSVGGAAATGELTEDIDPDAITDQLENELFTDANYLGNGIYKVPASLVCTETVYNSDGTTTESIDPDCAADLDQIQLRIRVASEDGGIRFYIQIDANHDEPLAILLAHDRLAVTINLDDAGDAMSAVAALEGETAPNADLSGSITASLKIIGAAHAEVALSFDRPLSVKFADDGIALDGPDATRFTSAAAQVIAIDLDGNAPKAKLDLGLGETTAHIPGDSIDPRSRDILLGGATVNASYQANTLTLENISLGTKTTQVSVDGQIAQTIDLNANAGRMLSATITNDPATGMETLAMSPKLDLETTTNHALLGDEAPVYDVTRVLLDGSLRGIADTDQVEVVSGTYSITTNPAQYGFSALAGQCVTSSYQTDPTTLEDYEAYSVGSCL